MHLPEGNSHVYPKPMSLRLQTAMDYLDGTPF